MAGRSRRELRGLQERALPLLEQGLTAKEVAEALGVSARTVRRWRRGGTTARPVDRKPDAEALAEMLRAESPAVARVILDLAKGGDVRAAALVVKLLGNTLIAAEGRDDGDSDAALSDLERELSSLPPEIASEIVGLLAQAESETAGRADDRSAAAGGAKRRSVRLPWQAKDHPPDQGPDSV